MTLERATVDVHLGGGVSQDSDPRAAPQGSFLTLENVVYDLKGAARKRAGYAAMTAPAGGSFPGAVALAVDGDALYCVTEATTSGTPSRLYSYAPTPDTWRSAGDVHRVSPSVAPLARAAVFSDYGFVAEVGGIRWELWREEVLGVCYRGIDIASGAVVYPRTLVGTILATLDTVLYCVCGTDIVIVESLDAGAGVAPYVRFLDTTTGTIATRGTGQIAAAAGFVAWSVVSLGATSFAVAFPGASSYVALVSTVNTTTIDSFTFGAANPVLTVALAKTGSSLYAVTWGGSAAGASHINAWLIATTPSLAVTWGPVDLGTASGLDAGRLAPAVRANGDLLAGWQNGITATFRGVTAAGAAYATTAVVPLSPFCSQPFLQDGRLYCALFTVTGYLPLYAALQPLSTVALVCVDSGLTSAASGDGPVLAAVLVRDRAVEPATPPVSVVTQPSATRVLLAAPVIEFGALASAGENQGVDSVTLDFSTTGFASHSDARAAGLVAMSGGFLGHTDGETFFEAGFLHQPDIFSVVHAVAGSIPPGEYGYAACYGWIDRAGNLHRSTPAFYTIDTSGDGANRQHTLTIRCITLTRKSVVFIEVYRTQSNTSGPYYRLSPPMLSGLASNPLASSITYTTDADDADLTALGYGTLYAPADGSGELDNVAPPAAFVVLSHKNRLWLVSAEDRREVWYSKPLVSGHPPEFAAELTMRLDDASEPITALASLDTNLVIFTASRIYYVAGDGPNATGGGSTFSDPQRVQNDAGCDDARSVGTLGDGALLTSARGAALLDRKLVVTFLGAPVKVDVDAYPTALGVVVDTVRMRALLALADSARTSFRVLVYDYEKSLWTTWRITGLAGSEPCRAHALWRGAHVIAGKGGVYLEALGDNPGYDPGLAWVTETIETPWLQTGGAGGYQRVWTVTVTGRRLSACSLKVEAFTDYGDTADSSRTFDLQSGSTVDGIPVVRLEMGIVKQRCSALKIRITDLAPATHPSVNPTGFDLLSITLDVGLMPGRARLPAVNKG